MAQLHDIEVDEYLAASVQVEPLALQEEFVKLPSDLAYWGERYARAWRAFNLAKIKRDRVAADLHTSLREALFEASKASATEAATSGGKVKVSAKAPTVGDIDAAVLVHPDMVAAEQEVLDTEVEKVRLWGVLEAIKCKKDMLVQLGAQARAEMQGNPLINEESRMR